MADKPDDRLAAACRRQPRLGGGVPALRAFVDGHGLQPDGLSDDRLDELYMAAACAEGDAVAAESFVERFAPAIRRLGSRRLRGPDLDHFVHDAAAHLLAPREGLSPRIASYAGKGALRSFVLMTSSRMLVDHLRAPRAAGGPSPEALANPSSSGVDPERVMERAEARDDVADIIAETLRVLPTNERRVLRMRFVLGFSADRVAKALDMHPVSVSRLVSRARARLAAAVRERLQAEAAGPAVIASALQGVDVSVARYLASNPEPPPS